MEDDLLVAEAEDPVAEGTQEGVADRVLLGVVELLPVGLDEQPAEDQEVRPVPAVGSELRDDLRDAAAHHADAEEGLERALRARVRQVERLVEPAGEQALEPLVLGLGQQWLAGTVERAVQGGVDRGDQPFERHAPGELQEGVDERRAPHRGVVQRPSVRHHLEVVPGVHDTVLVAVVAEPGVVGIDADVQPCMGAGWDGQPPQGCCGDAGRMTAHPDRAVRLPRE